MADLLMKRRSLLLVLVIQSLLWSACRTTPAADAEFASDRDNGSWLEQEPQDDVRKDFGITGCILNSGINLKLWRAISKRATINSFAAKFGVTKSPRRFMSASEDLKSFIGTIFSNQITCPEREKQAALEASLRQAREHLGIGSLEEGGANVYVLTKGEQNFLVILSGVDQFNPPFVMVLGYFPKT